MPGMSVNATEFNFFVPFRGRRESKPQAKMKPKNLLLLMTVTVVLLSGLAIAQEPTVSSLTSFSTESIGSSHSETKTQQGASEEALIKATRPQMILTSPVTSVPNQAELVSAPTVSQAGSESATSLAEKHPEEISASKHQKFVTSSPDEASSSSSSSSSGLGTVDEERMQEEKSTKFQSGNEPKVTISKVISETRPSTVSASSSASATTSSARKDPGQSLETSAQNTISTEPELEPSMSEPILSGDLESSVTTRPAVQSTQPIQLTTNVAFVASDHQKHDAGHFLVNAAPAEGPFPDEPTPQDANLEIDPEIDVELPGLNRVPTYRNADASPDVKDILSGLLNVVGEGLHLASNYVNDEQIKRKDKIKQSLGTRINNRGPPRFSEVPFEAIPLEILSTPKPGQPPGVQIEQRPFRLKVTRTKVRKPPFATGIPLPELLIPLPDGSDVDDFVEKRPDQERPLLYDEVTNVTIDVTKDLAELETTTPLAKLEHTYFPNVDLTSTTDEPEDEPPTTFFPTGDQEESDYFETKVTTPVAAVDEPPLTRFPPKRRPRPPKTTTESTTTEEDTTTSTTTPRTTSSTTSGPKRVSVVRRPTPPLAAAPGTAEVITGRPLLPPRGQEQQFGPFSPNFARPSQNNGEVFDVTVTAQQNFGGSRPGSSGSNNNNNKGGEIITAAKPGQEFVMIDGKRTYFDIGPTNRPLSGPSRTQITPTRTQLPSDSVPPSLLSGSPLPVQPVDLDQDTLRPLPVSGSGSGSKQYPNRKPAAPPIRIDTCIVGDDSTCEREKHEVCKTYLGVSSCFCRQGYGRKNHRQKCKKIVRLLMSMQVDRLERQKIFWSGNYFNPNSREYQQLESEANYAIDSAMALTSLNTVYMKNEVNKFFPLNGKITVNVTLELLSNSYSRSEVVKRDVQRNLIQVIQARGGNIGASALFVDGPLNPIPGVVDLNECADPGMNDCHELAECINLFGSFACQCKPGYGDRFAGDVDKAGRHCQSCSKDFCYGRGTCKIDNGQKECECNGNYYGRQCQIDGEVIVVAIGASVAAVFIIVLTLICLCLWSRRWKREQQKNELMHHHLGLSNTSTMYGSTPHLTESGGTGSISAAQIAAQMMSKGGAAAHYGRTQPQQLWAAAQMAAAQLEAMNQNIYAQILPTSAAGFGSSQFQPSLYSEPIYAYPASQAGSTSAAPPLPTSGPPTHAHPMSLYGTLPRRPPRPVINSLQGEQVLLNARQLINYATFRKHTSSRLFNEDKTSAATSTSSDSSTGVTTTSRRKIRWSPDDLILCTPKVPVKKLTSKAAKMQMEEKRLGGQEPENELLDTTLEEEDEYEDQTCKADIKNPPLPPRRPSEPPDKPPAPLPHALPRPTFLKSKTTTATQPTGVDQL